MRDRGMALSTGAQPSAPAMDAVGSGRHTRAPSRAGAGSGRRSLDTLRIALFLVVFFSIGRMHQHYGFIAVFRPALVLVGLATAMAVLQPRYLNSASILSTWHAKVVAAIGIMALASAPLGISLGGSAVFFLSDFSKTLLLCFLLIAAIRNAHDLAVLAWGFVLGCAFLVYLSLFFFHLGSIGGGLSRLNNLYMYDANDINSILLIGFGLLALLVNASRGFIRYGGLLLMLGMGASIARSGSRGGFLGLLVVGVALLVSLNQVSVPKRLGFVALIGLGLALYAPPGYWNQMATILAPKHDYNWTATDGRKQIWTRGLGYMLEYPIAGVGMNNFSRAECTISSKAREHVEGTGIACIAPHNSYLQMGAELGVPGLILWVTLLFGSIVKLGALSRSLPKQWERGDFEARLLFNAPKYLRVCFIGFAVTSFFVSHAYLDPIYILAALSAGTYNAIAERRAREAAVAIQATTGVPLGAPAGFPPLRSRRSAPS